MESDIESEKTYFLPQFNDEGAFYAETSFYYSDQPDEL